LDAKRVARKQDRSEQVVWACSYENQANKPKNDGMSFTIIAREKKGTKGP